VPDKNHSKYFNPCNHKVYATYRLNGAADGTSQFV